jgi:phytoene dehydrogenase-like protein
MNASASNQSFDIIVIGAGAAGLVAAYELALTGKKTAVIEAKERVGGRILSIADENFQLPVEGGAEFVHGDLKLTRQLLDKAGAKLYEVTGDIWQKEDGKIEQQDDFIEEYSILEKKFRELNTDLPVSTRRSV